MFEVNQIEELKRSFTSIPQRGKSLPNVKEVVEWTVFFRKETDGVYVEHIMIDGKWHKKVVDLNSQVVLEEV